MTGTATDTVAPPKAATNGAAMKPRFQMIGLHQLHESPRNPRKHFDQRKLEELSRSIEVSGVLTPLAVRPRPGGGYELAAGHRRRRAAQLLADRLGRDIDLPCLVHESMSDTVFMETLVVENGQREDVHPMEEAQGYFELMREEIGYDVQKIADRVGRKKDYIYDRIKLLSLIPKAQELFLANRFTLAHAIILARLAPADQERAIDPEQANRTHQALFTDEHTLWDPRVDGVKDAGDPWEGLKTRSPREFQAWVDECVRFDAAAPIVQDLFPATAAAVQAAEEAEEKVVHITYDYRVGDAARDEKTRTYGEQSWKRADGEEKSKTCEHSVTGVVVAGRGRGEAFRVCVAKKKCRVHWGAEIKAREKAEKEGAKNGGVSAAQKERERQQREREKWERQQKEEELQRARWRKAAPAIAEAVAARIESAKLPVLIDVLSDRIGVSKAASKRMPRGRTADDALRHFAFGALESRIVDQWQGPGRGAEYARRMGVDVKKLLDEHAPVAKGAATK